MQNIYTIHGKVTGIKSKLDLANLRVKVWDEDFASKHHKSSAVTGPDGSFRFQFD